EQVVRHNLPRIPIKEEDRRRAAFEDRRGEGAVELDALEALVPGELGRLVEGVFAPYRDPDLTERLQEAGEDAQDEVDTAWEEATREVREDLERIEQEEQAVLARYKPELQALNDRLKADLADVRRQLDDARHAVGLIVDTLAVSLPDRPSAETGEV